MSCSNLCTYRKPLILKHLQCSISENSHNKFKRLSLFSLRMEYIVFFIRMEAFAAGILKETNANLHDFVSVEREHH